MGDLTKNFSRVEFACKCGCGLDSIDLLIPRYLQVMRDDINADPEWIALNRGEFSIVIASGCRCLKHNATEYARLYPGKPVNTSSPHLPHENNLCKAVDCGCADNTIRYFLVKHGLQWFKNMEWGTNSWVHFDIVARSYGPSVFIP